MGKLFVELERVLQEHVGDDVLVFVRHAARELLSGDMASRDAEPITAEGAAAAAAASVDLAAVLSACKRRCAVRFMGSARTQQTAEALASCPQLPAAGPVTGIFGLPPIRLGDVFERYKAEHGYDALISAWLTDTLPPGVILLTQDLAVAVFRALAEQNALGRTDVRDAAGLSADGAVHRGLVTVIATHDIFIFALATCLGGKPVTSVPFLGGCIVPGAVTRAFPGSRS